MLKLALSLRKHGLKVLGDFSALGYDTFQPWTGMDISKGHPDEGELMQAREFGRGVAVRYKQSKSGKKITLPAYRIRLDVWLPISLFAINFAREILPEKKINKDRCKQCGKCVKDCPTSNIKLDPYPVFMDDCIYCYYCEKSCPKKAIECNWVLTMRRRTPERYSKNR